MENIRLDAAILMMKTPVEVVGVLGAALITVEEGLSPRPHIAPRTGVAK